MTRILNIALVGGFVGSLALLLPGCGNSPEAAAKAGAKLFQSADPEMKATWETAVAAASTNGYVVAILSLRKMIGDSKLTPEQVQAVQDLSKSVSDKMYAAAAKGEASGTNAIAELRKAFGR